MVRWSFFLAVPHRDSGSIGNARGTLTSLESSMSIANGAVCQLGAPPGRDCLTAVNGLREWSRLTPRPETVSVRERWHCAPNPCGEQTPGPAQTFDVPGLVGFFAESNLSYQHYVFGAIVSVCNSIHSCRRLISHVLDSSHLLLLLADPLHSQEMPLFSDLTVWRHHLTRDGGPSLDLWKPVAPFSQNFGWAKPGFLPIVCSALQSYLPSRLFSKCSA